MNSSDGTNYIKLCEALQQDFKTLISETRRKFPSIKETGEQVQKLLKELVLRKVEIHKELLCKSATIVQPLLQGCNTQLPKAVAISLNALQRLATHEVLTEEASAALIGVLWGLMEAGIEEVKLLQTAILLITTNSLVQSQNLARGLGLCFRLHDSKNSATLNTAAAALRQCVSAIVDRMIQEHQVKNYAEGDIINDSENGMEIDYNALRANPRTPPPTVTGFAKDVFMLFQDLCLLINKEETVWLQGLNGVNQTMGLELLELILVDYTQIFITSPEFTFLLKEKLCPLIIKLFSPSLKFKPNLMGPQFLSDRPNFTLLCRLIRIITVIIRNYFFLLNTECEIFMSLLIRFLETEKPLWQRSLALEVFYKCVSDPKLIKHICENYDMREHSTKILREIISALNTFIQARFMNPSLGQTNNPGNKDNTTTANSSTGYVPAFHYKGATIPVYMNLKIIFYDMLEKSEPPPPPDGYSLSVAFHCLLETVKSIQAIVEDVDNVSQLKLPDLHGNKELVDACWGGILSSLSILLESSNDETATEAILRGLRSMVSLCGEIEFSVARDAFVTTICKASLPSNIAMTVVNGSSTHNSLFDSVSNKEVSSITTDDLPTNIELSTLSNSAVNTSGNTSSSAVMGISDKNIQCVRSLLNVAHCHGSLLGTSWNVVLLTLQSMVNLLGLAVSSMGSIVITGKPVGANNSANANVNNVQNTPGSTNNLSSAVVADLPVLSAMLGRLFECSQMMSESALNNLVDALCKLSKESTEKGKTNKDPSLFAVAKLMETGLANIKRPNVWWTPVLKSLIEAASQGCVSLRKLAADAIISLVKEAINSNDSETPFWSNKELYELILEPLSKLSEVRYSDVRLKQLDCVQHILHHSGDHIGDSWYRIIQIIGAIQAALNDQLVRHAFQCFQLVSTDYLTALGCDCYRIVVTVAATFAQQDQDLNISLSAIGSIWYISDFFYQQAENMQNNIPRDEIDELWILIFTSLVDICVDTRPAVRKSAGQTLFNTIDLHGQVIQQKTWSVLMWKVLFPLMDRVRDLRASAPEKRCDNDGSLLMHHSRDTAAKQWSETQVLTLTGIAQTFSGKQAYFLKLDDFPKAWTLLLEAIEMAALLLNQEVAESALRCLQTMLDIKASEKLLWQQWETWVRIGERSTILVSDEYFVLIEHLNNKDKPLYLPTPKFLTILLELFPALFEKVRFGFGKDDLISFTKILRQTLEIHLLHHSPVIIDHCTASLTATGGAAVNGAASIATSLNPSLSVQTEHGYISPLQKVSLDCLDAVSMSILDQSDKLNCLLGTLFTISISLANYSVQLPPDLQKLCKSDQIPASFISFGENCMELVVSMYKKCPQNVLVLKNSVLDQIIFMLYLPLSMKYNCPSQSTWLLASQCLMSVMKIGIPIAKTHVDKSEKMWEILSRTLEDFLFSNQPCPSGLSVEDFQKNQELDCRFIHLIKELILSDSAGIPDSFIEELINLLNAGTIDTTSTNHYTDLENFRSFREDFARLCFETLLQYSYMGAPSSSDNASESGFSFGSFGSKSHQAQKAGTVSKAAVKATLEKCHNVLSQYVQDEKLSGKCPLPRSRLLEVKFVFKALSTLLTAFENTPAGRIEQSTWDQIIDLYPLVVDCVSVTGAHFLKSLREVLHKYQYLLKPR